LFFSCSEVQILIPDGPGPANGRILLIEEFTGVECARCAPASILLKSIAEDSEGAIVYYAVHGGFLAEPHVESKYDFRNPAAYHLETSNIFFGKPAASFNRVLPDNGETAKSLFNTWQPFIDAELAKKQVIEISMSTDYNATTRQVTVFVGVTLLEDIDGKVNLNMLITESHLIDPQDSPTTRILDFEHNHVVKSFLSSVDGDMVGINLKAEETINRTYSYTIPTEDNGEWTVENMEITAFVTSEDRNGEVQQAAQILLVRVAIILLS